MGRSLVVGTEGSVRSKLQVRGNGGFAGKGSGSVITSHGGEMHRVPEWKQLWGGVSKKTLRHSELP